MARVRMPSKEKKNWEVLPRRLTSSPFRNEKETDQHNNVEEKRGREGKDRLRLSAFSRKGEGKEEALRDLPGRT